MADFYRDVIRYLRDNGYELKRQGRGDHEIWWNPQTGVRVTVETEVASYGERDPWRCGAAEGVLI